MIYAGQSLRLGNTPYAISFDPDGKAIMSAQPGSNPDVKTVARIVHQDRGNLLRQIAFMTIWLESLGEARSRIEVVKTMPRIAVREA